jgi:hypothetical protein
MAVEGMAGCRGSFLCSCIAHTRKRSSLAGGDCVLTPRSDPFGLSQVEAFGNSLEDSVSFRFPSWLSLAGSPFLR